MLVVLKQVDSLVDIEFGGNGKTFAENYATDYNDGLKTTLLTVKTMVTTHVNASTRKQEDSEG